jgi:hypothetical protein
MVRYCALESACIAIEIPKKAIPGNPTNNTLICFVGRIDADPEKGSMLVVKQIMICERDSDSGPGSRIGR